MNEQEKAFWVWWEKIKDHTDLYNLRMAFDAGYESAIKLLEGDKK